MVLLEELPEAAEQPSAAAFAALAVEERASGGGEAADAAEDDSPAARAEALRLRGNAAFGRGAFLEAEVHYTEALAVAQAQAPSAGVDDGAAPPPAPREHAVYFANRAACRLSLGRLVEAAEDCSAALAIDGGYVKARRRSARHCCGAAAHAAHAGAAASLAGVRAAG